MPRCRNCSHRKLYIVDKVKRTFNVKSSPKYLCANARERTSFRIESFILNGFYHHFELNRNESDNEKRQTAFYSMFLFQAPINHYSLMFAVQYYILCVISLFFRSLSLSLSLFISNQLMFLPKVLIKYRKYSVVSF